MREIYDGQVFVKLKEGLDLPAMDPWVCINVNVLFSMSLCSSFPCSFSVLMQYDMFSQGTSDPYVVMELDGQVVKSSTKWG